MASVTLDRAPLQRRHIWRTTALWSIGIGVCILAALLWRWTGRTVHVRVDGQLETVVTHRAKVGDLLIDLGIDPGPSDRVVPPLTAALTPGMQLVLERARPLRILADGRDLHLSSWGSTARAVLADADIAVDTGDLIRVDGELVGVDDSLPVPLVERSNPRFDLGFAWDAIHTAPLTIRVVRAAPMVVDEGGLPYTINTTAQTVGEALRGAGVILYLGDQVLPSLGSRVIPNMRVHIRRSTPIWLEVDGRQIKTRTQAKTVGEALADLGAAVSGRDRVNPPLAAPLYENTKITITRVRDDVEVEEEIEPFETVFVGDPNLPIDTQQVLDPGASGITRTRYRVRYENGEEVSRVKEDRWIAQRPADRRIAYGQDIQPQTAVVDGQPITYWRKFKAYATSYHPAAVGGGLTATGDVVGRGVVAVDPRIIPLRSGIFVPGYGTGTALDTGGAIRSRRIDLGYDDSNFVSLSKWVDVYLLWPPPAGEAITWVLPNYPPVPE